MTQFFFFIVCIYTHYRDIIENDPKLASSFNEGFADLLRYCLSLGDQLACVKLRLNKQPEIL